MTDDIIVSDDDWPRTQTNDGESDCADIIVPGEPRETDLSEWSE
jgi:hypothetical protein